MGHLLGTAHLLGDWMLIGSKLEQTSSESADSTFSIFQQKSGIKNRILLTKIFTLQYSM